MDLEMIEDLQIQTSFERQDKKIPNVERTRENMTSDALTWR